MEEILASIRRIIADDETKAKSAEPLRPPPPAPPPQPSAAAPRPMPPPLTAAPMNQVDIDTMLASLDAPSARGNGKVQVSPDVLELTESMMAASAESSQPPVFRTIEGQSDVFFTEETEGNAEMAPETPLRQAAPERQDQVAQAPEAPLISASTSAAVDQAFNTLAHTVLSRNARTLEDLVRELMRPMLKAWLDDNLPGLVERVVRAEIERVSRGQR